MAYFRELPGFSGPFFPPRGGTFREGEAVMPSTRKLTTKSGKTFYEIRVRLSRKRSELTTRWYPPKGWSERSIQRELARQAADFERRCRAGEVFSRAERIAREEAAAKEITVRKFGEEVFMPAKTVTCSENTRYTFQRLLRKHVYPVIGDCMLRDVTGAQISALLLDYQSTGAKHSSCLRVYGVLQLLFKMAYLNDTLDKNPMDKVTRPRPRKDEGKSNEVESFTIDELRHIMACLEFEPLKWQALVRLMIDTGVRRGEVCGLQWGDLNLRENTVTISRTLNYTSDRGVFVSTTKNGQGRVVDIDPSVAALLRKYRSELKKRPAPEDFLFTRDGSTEPLNPIATNRYMRHFGDKYGVENMHPHKLRHTFASIALTNGADVVSISKILGHSDTSITLRVYAHSDAESRKRASNVFRDAVRDKKPKK